MQKLEAAEVAADMLIRALPHEAALSGSRVAGGFVTTPLPQAVPHSILLGVESPLNPKAKKTLHGSSSMRGGQKH